MTEDQYFYQKFNQFNIQYGSKFSEIDGSLTTHRILMRLNEGITTKYDPNLHSNLPLPNEVKTALEFVRTVSET
jgi:hypothetical protein